MKFVSKRKIALFAPVAAFVLLFTVAVVIFIGRVTPLLAAERALVNLGGDVSLRLEASPLGAFLLLEDALTDGVLNISVEYSDQFTAGGLSFAFHSDEPNRVYKMLVEGEVDGFAFDFEIHMDSTRIAVSSSLLGEDIFGLTYATFREDIRPFALMLGLSDDEINELADIVEMIGDFMEMPDPGLEAFEAYQALLREFILNGTVSSESTSIIAGGQSINVTRAEFRFTNNDMLQLLRSFLVTMSEDTNMDPFGMIDEWMWDEVLGDFDFLLSELEDFEGNMYLVMYIGPENRLVQIEVVYNVSEDGYSVELFFGADFGLSVFDPWSFTLDVTTTDTHWLDETRVYTESFGFDLLWSFTENEGRFINTFSFSASAENIAPETFTIVSDWNSNTGDFVLSIVDVFEIRGIYRLDSYGGFMLRFDPIDTDYESLSIEISAKIGSNITPVQNFINFSDIPLGTFLDLLTLF